MFSSEDVKEIFQVFTTPKDYSTAVSSLVLASDGSGFITLRHLETTFKECITRETQRIPVSSLARDLNVQQDIVRQLVDTHPGLALLSFDSSDIVALDERVTLRKKLDGCLSDGIVLKLNFATQNDIDSKSIDILLRDVDGQLVYFDDYVCSKSYEDRLADSIMTFLKRSLNEMQSIDLDPTNLPGTPPTWFTLRTLRTLLDSQNLVEQFHVQEESGNIHCVPKQLTEHKRDAIIDDLQSGALAYLNLQSFWKDFPELFATGEEAHGYVQNLSEVQIMDAFAVSSIRILNLEKECVQILREEGCVDLTHIAEGFPEGLRGRIAHKVEQNILVTFEQESEPKPYRIGDFMVTATHRDEERAALLGYATLDASAQWQQLQDSPGKEVKFSLSNITAMITNKHPLQSALAKDKLLEKALDEQFWSTISKQEIQNESEFSTFWLDRVVARCHVYNEGLGAVQDQKLHDQLAELLTSYIQKDLFPDSVSKARSQGLVLSRKTRKNISRLETVLKAEKTTTTTSVLAALGNFNKKQGIETPDSSRVEEAKKVVMSDMVRRMQKQKQSDGPVLFLTLTLILFARQHTGVVYATGKFAPKLLKQLKPSLGPEQYEQLERWKEAAKAGTLSAEERQEMKKMAEA
ncbi:uncharacterized protein K460DRAFT_344011 [Cucurbitaria berberidis CBS 394.84]|uniref:Uncharacterized protein n=1 Tax=Cucurbitaria berberidis CBS 394.84 TaxID=1168544 RepID=A0A9P4G9V6_9PLEO|nr:uncharacterized protein K460DRAFT_344011 [Cucurbitaria berberidis CBS 394.84]KAF1841360.1 hypothetical protein K460DRAFT_344011 [Cucurbitaria berberidis CBS 394.84]